MSEEEQMLKEALENIKLIFIECENGSETMSEGEYFHELVERVESVLQGDRW